MTADVGSTHQVQGHPAVRTLLLTRGELSAWVLDQRTGETRQLNNSAAAVWALLDRPSTVDELTEEFAELVGLDRPAAAELVTAALDTFRDAELLDGPEATAATSGDAHAVDDPEDRDAEDRDHHDEPDVEAPQRLTRRPDP